MGNIFSSRYLDWRGIALGVVLIAALYFSGALHRLMPDNDAYAAALTAVVKCTLQTDAVQCSRPFIEHMLQEKSGKEIMGSLEKRLPAQQCHYIGHVVGQQLYIQKKDIESAIGQCDRSCDSACVHGIIGESFAETLGFGSVDDAQTKQNFDIEHLNVDQIQTLGKKLCTSPQSCHGVGHTLFQIYGKFQPALALCDAITASPNNYYCYQGTFMEYADLLSSRNMRSIAQVQFPKVSDLATICDLSNFSQRRSCYRYFPRIVTDTLQENGMSLEEARKKMIGMCGQLPRPDDKIACVIGYGVNSSYSVLYNTTSAVKTCENFATRGDQAACYFGEISVATQDRQSQVMAYCKAIPDEEFKGDCYQQVFYFLNRLGTPAADAKKLCGDDALCLKGFENNLVDPWVKLRKNYAS